MFTNFIRTAFLVGGAMLLAPGRPIFAQDANRDSGVRVVDMQVIVHRLASHTGNFKSSFDHEIEKSMLDGTKIEDRLKRRADDLHDFASKLKDEFHDKKDKTNPKVRDKADQTLSAGADINRVMM